jgi:hypothetical protein
VGIAEAGVAETSRAYVRERSPPLPGSSSASSPTRTAPDYASAIPLLSRIRLTTWLLIGWTVFGAAAAYWGYRSVMESCPPFDDFSGCFEPPYRFAAGIFFMFWATVEAVLAGAWLLRRFSRQ